MENVMGKSHVISWKKLRWILLVGIAILYSCTLCYDDIDVSYYKGFKLFDAIVTGNFPGNYTFESPFYILVHVIFAFWSIPDWFLVHFGVLSADSAVNLLWARILITFAYAGCIILLKEILKRLEVTSSDSWLFIIAASFTLFMPIFDGGMYDHFELFFGLYALNMLLKEGKLSYKVVVILSIASTIKLFFAFAAIVIVLIGEKNLCRLIKKLVVFSLFPLLIFGVSKCIVHFYPQCYDQVLSVDSFPTFFLDNSTTGGIWDISLFFVALVSAYVIAFFAKNYGRHTYHVMFWLISLIYSCMFFLVPCHPQWNIFIIPFWGITMSMKKNGQRAMAFLCVFDALIFFSQASYYSWVYLTEGSFSRLLLKSIPVNGGVTSFSAFLESHALFPWMRAVEAAAAVIGISLLVLSNPWKAIETIDENEPLIVCSEESFMDKIGMLQISTLIIYYIMNLLINFVV